MATSRHF